MTCQQELEIGFLYKSRKIYIKDCNNYLQISLTLKNMAYVQCKQEGMCKSFPTLLLLCVSINSLLVMNTHLLD